MRRNNDVDLTPAERILKHCPRAILEDLRSSEKELDQPAPIPLPYPFFCIILSKTFALSEPLHSHWFHSQMLPAVTTVIVISYPISFSMDGIDSLIILSKIFLCKSADYRKCNFRVIFRLLE